MKGKKFLAILLTLAMLCTNIGSMLPAFAEGNDIVAEASVPEAPAAAPVETPQEAPAEPPAAGGTDDSQGEPAEAPQTEPAEAPQAEPADETTDDTQDEPQPEAGEQSEPTGDASEGAGEAAQENAAALALSGLKADAESAAVGQTIRWTFEASGAESVSWKAVGADGATAGQGDCEDGAFTWTPAESGIYTVTVTASAGEQSLTEDAKITVRDGALSVSVPAADVRPNSCTCRLSWAGMRLE